MKDILGPDSTSQLQEAHRLLEEGEVREALVLAMDALWRELDQLRTTLQAVQEHLPPPPEQEMAGSDWPAPLSYLLH